MAGLVNLDRKDVYITNTTCCRPPDNRDPLPEEKAQCAIYLQAKIDLINPDVICTLGRHAMSSLIKTDQSISQLHGRVIKFKNKLWIPLYHPAAVLYNVKLRESFETDFMQLKKILSKVEVS